MLGISTGPMRMCVCDEPLLNLSVFSRSHGAHVLTLTGRQPIVDDLLDA